MRILLQTIPGTHTSQLRLFLKQSVTCIQEMQLYQRVGRSSDPLRGLHDQLGINAKATQNRWLPGTERVRHCPLNCPRYLDHACPRYLEPGNLGAVPWSMRTLLHVICMLCYYFSEAFLNKVNLEMGEVFGLHEFVNLNLSNSMLACSVLCPLPVTPWSVAHQGSSVYGAFQARILSQLPFPIPGASLLRD